jgi:hypothetical protein
MSVVLGIGTMKGAWIASSADRETWSIDGPFLKGWEVTTLGRIGDDDFLLSTASSWYGSALHRSTDLSEWNQVVDGPAYGEQEGRALSRIWTIASSKGSVYAGVAEAGLFRSTDGLSWSPVPGLNDHPTRPGWGPGLGGLMAHRVLFDPADPRRMWCAISAVGVFRTDDGGTTWAPKNAGISETDPNEEYPGIGYCVHSITHDPDDANRMWRQDHAGVYQSSDGGDSWERIQEGLPNPSGFGFPIVRHHTSGALFLVPLESDEYRLPVDGALRVYRSLDDGESWHAAGTGWSDRPSYTGVLRDAMDCDQRDPGGVYYGTSAGTVGYTADGGETWSELPAVFPRISSVRVLSA